jgi:hypothetical protein
MLFFLGLNITCSTFCTHLLPIYCSSCAVVLILVLLVVFKSISHSVLISISFTNKIFCADWVSDCPSENIGEKCTYNSNSNDITMANVRCKER